MASGPVSPLAATFHKLGRVRRDRILGRDGAEHTLTILENAGAVYVVPRTRDGKALMLQQYRQSIDAWGCELPAGGLFDHTGDSQDLAAKELREEAARDSLPVRTHRTLLRQHPDHQLAVRDLPRSRHHHRRAAMGSTGWAEPGNALDSS
ncbi:NUDIX domain-containing protein [Nocardia sp. NPDC059246]|uniref:NUDIX domain-containing protein n=1 Tax=Nocardia sp. NPDC059246 TaxID=3346789 RepID=UPI003680F310